MSRIVAQQGQWTAIATLHGENGNVRINQPSSANCIGIGVPRIHLGPVISLVAVRISLGGAGLHEETAAVDIRFVFTHSPANASGLEILLGLANPFCNLAGQPLGVSLITICS